MTRKDFGFLLVLMLLSGFAGAVFNSWLTGASEAYAQPVPYGEGRPGPEDMEEILREAIRDRDRAVRAGDSVPDQQLALPDGVITARAFQLTDREGQIQCMLTTRTGRKGPQLVLKNAAGHTIWTAPDIGGVRFVD